MNYTINIAKEFSKTPGGRKIENGDKSGEEFRESLLKPRYISAKESGKKLVVDIDGGYGYATSFIEEAFGGLAREFPRDNILSTIEIVSNDDVSWLDRINGYINKAKK